MDIDQKISFFTGGILTLIMTAPLVEIGMALILGIIGGFSGMLGKYFFTILRDKFSKKKSSN